MGGKLMTPMTNLILCKKTTYFQRSKSSQKVAPTTTQSHRQQNRNMISLIQTKNEVGFNGRSTITNQSPAIRLKFTFRLWFRACHLETTSNLLFTIRNLMWETFLTYWCRLNQNFSRLKTNWETILRSQKFRMAMELTVVFKFTWKTRNTFSI